MYTKNKNGLKASKQKNKKSFSQQEKEEKKKPLKFMRNAESKTLTD